MSFFKCMYNCPSARNFFYKLRFMYEMINMVSRKYMSKYQYTYIRRNLNNVKQVKVVNKLNVL